MLATPETLLPAALVGAHKENPDLLAAWAALGVEDPQRRAMQLIYPDEQRLQTDAQAPLPGLELRRGFSKLFKQYIVESTAPAQVEVNVGLFKAHINGVSDKVLAAEHGFNEVSLKLRRFRMRQKFRLAFPTFEALEAAPLVIISRADFDSITPSLSEPEPQTKMPKLLPIVITTNPRPCQSNPDEFYVKGAKQNAVVQICKSRCPESLAEKCLDEALDNKIEWGVWGGMTERERRKIVKARETANKKRLEAIKKAQEAAAALAS